MSFKIDLHVHTATTSRCGEVEPEEIVRMYEEAGYDGIVITDHFYKAYFEGLGNIPWKEKIDLFLEGYRRVKKAAKKIEVFLGLEYRNQETDDDFLVYGLTEEFLYNKPNVYELLLPEAIAQFHKAGAIVIQAHPIRMRMYQKIDDGTVSRKFKTDYMLKVLRENPHITYLPYKEGRKMIKEGDTKIFDEPVFLEVCHLRYPQLLDGIECYNGNYNWVQEPKKIQEILEKYPHLIPISSSDFHEKGHCARGGTVFENEIHSAKELVHELKCKKIQSWIKSE